MMDLLIVYVFITVGMMGALMGLMDIGKNLGWLSLLYGWGQPFTISHSSYLFLEPFLPTE